MQELKFCLHYIEILIALPCLRRVFYLYIEHTHKNRKREKCFFVQKTNAGRQSTRQMQELKFCLHHVEILIALPYLRRVFYLYIEHAHKNRKRAKMLFCAKTIKRRQTKYKANARVEILTAIALLTH